jgi:hypothetical protein
MHTLEAEDIDAFGLLERGAKPPFATFVFSGGRATAFSAEEGHLDDAG